MPFPTIVASGAVALGTSSLSVPYYAGLAANDIAIILVYAYGNVTFGSASGFTAESQVNTTQSGTPATRCRIYWKRLVGSESGTVSISTTSADASSGRMIGARDCILTGTPYEGYASNNGNTGTTMTSPSTVTSGPDRLLLRFWGTESVDTSTPPATWTEEYESANGTAGFTVIACDSKQRATAGTESASTRTQTDNSSYVSFGLALMPPDVIAIPDTTLLRPRPRTRMVGY